HVDFWFGSKYHQPTLRAVRGPSKVATRLCVVLCALLAMASLSVTARASTSRKLNWAKHRLHQLEHDIGSTQSRLQDVKRSIAAQETKLRSLQSQLNGLADRLSL